MNKKTKKLPKKYNRQKSRFTKGRAAFREMENRVMGA
jgi:hypothetical protein